MKILKFANNEIGPFNIIERTVDGYMCDGGLFPMNAFGDYIIVDVPDQYVTLGKRKQLEQEVNAEAEIQRIEAYKKESDPLFFKYQRNESTKEDWLAKVEEIKQRYPYSHYYD